MELKDKVSIVSIVSVHCCFMILFVLHAYILLDIQSGLGVVTII